MSIPPSPPLRLALNLSNSPSASTSPASSPVVSTYGLPAVSSSPTDDNYKRERYLAGVDFLTIAPALLEELKKSSEPVPKKLDAAGATSCRRRPYSLSDTTFLSACSAAPEYRDQSSFPGDMNEFLTSPFDTPYDDFNTSPADDSPFSPDLNTSIMNDISSMDMYTDMHEHPLFDDLAASLYSFPYNLDEISKPAEPTKESAQRAASTSDPQSMLDAADFYTFSPQTPMLDLVNPSSLYPSPRVPTSRSFSPAPGRTLLPDLSFPSMLPHKLVTMQLLRQPLARRCLPSFPGSVLVCRHSAASEFLSFFIHYLRAFNKIQLERCQCVLAFLRPLI
ncbi:hypothetical protein K435DRAFT_874424 [Dendrothele bispora CBS 962.96]|uniref:Uncharacterized protein n=1 Tax=Dendrothele bispora (strain CBS 962.96) TaxID=1314807 RepID=A0A4S8KXT9_DENBC|nr:hypothetical protein K435DRAFT_874424 [Dendrothele bispora CBS 962.96]